MTIERITRGESETMALAESVARQLHGGDFLALDGPLGSGKTCFVRGLARGLGIDPASVSSPTFVICQEYAGQGQETPLRLVHIDAYRLAGPDELQSIGWDELLSDSNAIIVVEWAARLADALPPARISIEFEHIAPDTRRIILNAPSPLAARLKDESSRRPPSLEGGGQGVGESAATRKRNCKCPICGKPVPGDSPTYPFCSPRCRLVDLGRWFSGKYQVSRPLDPQDEDEQVRG